MIHAYLILDFSYCTLAVEVNGALVLYKDIQRDMKLFDRIYADLGELNIDELSIIVKTEPVEDKVSVANSYGLINSNCDADLVRAIESLVKQLQVKDYKIIDALSVLNNVHDTVVLYKVCSAMYAIAVTHAPCAMLCLNGDNSRVVAFMNKYGITDVADLSLQEFGGVTASNFTQAQHFYLLSNTKDTENVNYISIENITSDKPDDLVSEIIEDDSVEPEEVEVPTKKQKNKKSGKKASKNKSYESKKSKIPFLVPVCLLLLAASFGLNYYLGMQSEAKSAELTNAYDEYNECVQKMNEMQEQASKDVSFATIDALNRLFSLEPKSLYVYYGDGKITVYCEVKKKATRTRLITEMQDAGADVSYKGKLSDAFVNPSDNFNDYIEEFNLKTNSAIIIQMEE